MAEARHPLKVNDLPSCFWDALHGWRQAVNVEEADFETRRGPSLGEPSAETLALHAVRDAAADKLIRIMEAYWLDRDLVDRVLDTWGLNCGEEGCWYCDE